VSVDAPGILVRDLSLGVPSLVQACIDLESVLVAKRTDKPTKDVSNVSLPELLIKARYYEHNAPIMSHTAELLAIILKLPQLDKLRQIVTKQGDWLLPAAECPRFGSFSLVLPDYISALPQGSGALSKACAYTTGLGRNSHLFSAYIGGAVAAAAATNLEPYLSPNSLMDLMLRWCSSCHGNDCYAMPDRIGRWAELLFDYCDTDDTVLHLCFTVHQFMPRFLSYVVALIRFWRAHPGIELASSLEKSGPLCAVRAHAAALQLVARRDFARAVEVAAFVADCPESDALIEELGTAGG